MVSRVRLALRVVDPLSIGGLASPRVDMPVLKIGDKPVIPGTSLRGVLRSVAEAYGLCSCDVIDRAFGREGNLSCVRIGTIMLSGDTITRIRTAMDYASGRVREGALFAAEYVAPCTQAELVIEFECCEPDVIKCVASTLSVVRVVGIGRGRARIDLAVSDVDGDCSKELLDAFNEAGLGKWMWDCDWQAVCG